MQEEGAYQWDIEAEQMSQRHDQEMQGIEQILADKKITEDQYQIMRAQTERKHDLEILEQRKKVEQSKMQLASTTFG